MKVTRSKKQNKTKQNLGIHEVSFFENQSEKAFSLWCFRDISAWKQESEIKANGNSFLGSNPMFPL